MLTAMKGVLANDPQVREVPIKGSDEKVKLAQFALIYQKDAESVKTYPQCVAWRDVAEKVADMKKGDEIEFMGKLTHSTYKNPLMEKSRNELGFTVLAVDESKTICKKLEEFLGVERRPGEKEGAVFQPMRGRLFEKPEMKEITVGGEPALACNATIRFWSGKSKAGDVFVPITAYNEQAKLLAGKEKNDTIEFAGRLDAFPYRNPNMTYSHMELCYTVQALDPENTLCKKTDAFLQEQMGFEKKPLQDRLQDAEARKNAQSADTKEAPNREQPEPVK